jgi:hypothetical protein
MSQARHRPQKTCQGTRKCHCFFFLFSKPHHLSSLPVGLPLSISQGTCGVTSDPRPGERLQGELASRQRTLEFPRRTKVSKPGVGPVWLQVAILTGSLREACPLTIRPQRAVGRGACVRVHCVLWYRSPRLYEGPRQKGQKHREKFSGFHTDRSQDQLPGL